MITRASRSILPSLRHFSSEVVAEQSNDKRLKKIGRALETYLKQSKEHTAMMNRERADFELGRRHLANMMSLDANTMTQSDIDSAIEYLFPSGLSDPKARPVMRPPDEIIPQFKQFTFDDEGRPNGSRFYTLSPNYYTLLSDIGIKTQNVTRFYNERAELGRLKDADMQIINLSGSQWLNEEKMKKKLKEKFSTEMYVQLMMALDYLVSIPGSAVEADFINEYREPLAATTDSKLFGPKIPEVEICKETNRRTATVRTHCKNTTATVTVSDAGTGKFDIDGLALYDFRSLLAREILLAPLIVSDLLDRVDVKANVENDGITALPKAVRHGTSLCIAALYPESMEALRLAGLLTLDPRKKERSKVNQPGARAKWIWKRR
ncbi:unnamed protein product [Auanema sp. JU1783]|nr:unnamed protein product [Auanema sp. JU1783]